MSINLAELERLAKAATPGPWAIEHDVRVGGCSHLAITNRACGGSWMPCSITRYDLRREIDDHNAAVSPEVVLRLIAALRDMKAWAIDTAKWVHVTRTGGPGIPLVSLPLSAFGITDTPTQEE